MPIMIVADLRSWERTFSIRLLPHQWEERRLFSLHMLFQFDSNLFERIGKTLGRLGMAGMNGLDFPSEASELGQFASMGLMIAGHNMIDQGASCFGRSSGATRIECGKSLQDCRGVQAALADPFGQAHVAAATEVELEPSEYGRRTGQGRGDIADKAVSQRVICSHSSRLFLQVLSRSKQSLATELANAKAMHRLLFAF